MRPLTMVEKLSSARTMSEASLATSVPAMPMATPMSASFSAGASFTPSPVMAATCTITRVVSEIGLLDLQSSRISTIVT